MNTQQINTLKQCPFCGADGFFSKMDAEYWVECTRCSASTRTDNLLTRQDAAAAWNRRAPLAAHPPAQDAPESWKPTIVQLAQACSLYERGEQKGRPENGMADAFDYLRGMMHVAALVAAQDTQSDNKWFTYDPVEWPDGKVIIDKPVAT